MRYVAVAAAALVVGVVLSRMAYAGDGDGAQTVCDPFDPTCAPMPSAPAPSAPAPKPVAPQPVAPTPDGDGDGAQ